MPYTDATKAQAFALWLQGVSLTTIQQRLCEEPAIDPRPMTIELWVRDWERGRQGVWVPLMKEE